MNLDNNNSVTAEVRSTLSGFLLLGALVSVLMSGGCASAPKTSGTTESKPELVWPPAPNSPRIAYVQSVRAPADLGIKTSGFGRLANWITGAEKGNEPLRKPFGVSLDEAGNLCVTDTGANAVCYFDRANKKWQRWEKVGKQRFLSPVSVAKQGDRIFVADSVLQSVIIFNRDGKLLFQITEKLERPSGVVVSGEHLFVVDSQRHCVLSFDFNGRYLAEFGKRGIGFGEFNFPTHISADTRGNLYVTDSINGRIQVFDQTGKFVRKIGEMGHSTGQFSRPKGVAADSSGRVYVIDGLFDNVQIFSGEGKFLLNFGEAGSSPGEFWLPNGIAISHSNEIFVADSYNHRVQIFKYVGEP